MGEGHTVLPLGTIRCLDSSIPAAGRSVTVAARESIHFVYDMPFLQCFKGVAGAIRGGWQTKGIVTLKTGLLFAPAMTSDLSTGRALRSDRLKDGRLDNPTRQKRFDPSAFQRVTCSISARPELCHCESIPPLGEQGAAAVPGEVVPRLQHASVRDPEDGRDPQPRFAHANHSVRVEPVLLIGLT
jgi:hypothetical protein